MFRPVATTRRLSFLTALMICPWLLAVPACSSSAGNTGTSAVSVLRLATTTSTRDSGLFDQLVPMFEERHPCRVDVVAVGTGAALKLGEAGDVDVVVVHSRQAEEAFLAAKHGIRHEEFMYNHFVLLGPQDDPARTRGMEPADALARIAENEQRFVSRGDDSGTHKREVSLWEAAGGCPNWPDYVESGQGMAPTLMMADEKRSYVLADMGTFLNFQDKIELVPLVAEAQTLRNPYAAIVVNPAKHSQIDGPLADAFVDFLVSEESQRLIAGYQVAGRALFNPTRIDVTK